MVKNNPVPAQGDIVWLTLSPQEGNEQAGRRPAIVLSPKRHNERTNLALVCPITSKIKGYPLEVVLPSDIPIKGAILVNHIRSVDWKQRKADFICSVSTETLEEVSAKISVLLP